jgi:peptidoglycan/xylan/chitin deacetylase (PgdA/CDA1 family)
MTKLIYNTLRNLLYTFCYVLTGWQKSTVKGFILCYHSISDDNWDFSVSLKNFREQIDYLLQNYQPVSLSEIEKYLDCQLTLDKPFFAVTFDDGYHNITETVPYLKEKNIKPTVFLLSDTDHANHKEMDSNYSFLTYEDVQNLEQSGWNFGCHSATHPDFDELDEKAINSEISIAKADLTAKLGREIKYFAYPKGRYNTQVRQAVADSGYKLGLSMDSKMLTNKSDKFAVPRVGVMRMHSFTAFKALTLPLSTKLRSILLNAQL